MPKIISINKIFTRTRKFNKKLIKLNNKKLNKKAVIIKMELGRGDRITLRL